MTAAVMAASSMSRLWKFHASPQVVPPPARRCVFQPESRPMNTSKTCLHCISIITGAYSAESTTSSTKLAVMPITPPPPRRSRGK